MDEQAQISKYQKTYAYRREDRCFRILPGTAVRLQSKSPVFGDVRDPAYAEYTKPLDVYQTEKYKSLEKYPGTKVIANTGPENFTRAMPGRNTGSTNYHLPSGIKKEADQVYIQTWHGTPLKKNRLRCAGQRNSYG